MDSRADIQRLIRRIVREVIALNGTASTRQSYWVSLREGERAPHMGGAVQSNVRDFAWDVRNHPNVRGPLKELGERLDEFHAGRLIRRSQRIGSQMWRVEAILNSALVAAVAGRTSSKQVTRLVAELVRELTSETYSWKMVVPLEDVRLASERGFINLGDATKLRSMPIAERELLLNADMLSLSSGAQGSVARSCVALEHVVTIDAGLDLGVSQFECLVESSRLIATLLSAVAGSDIRIAGFFAAPSPLYPLSIPFSHVPEMPIYKPVSHPLELAGSSARLLRDATGAALSGPNSKTVKIALARLFELMNHRDPGDRLIDAWIALESLFLSDGRAELKFRAAIRIAGFDGGSDREAIYDFVRRSYDMRSTLVHGDSPKLDSLQAIADGTVSLARSSTIRILRQQTRFDPAAIERALLGSDPSRGC